MPSLVGSEMCIRDRYISLSRHLSWQLACGLLGRMKLYGLDPNVVSYGISMDACAKAGRWEKVKIPLACTTFFLPKMPSAMLRDHHLSRPSYGRRNELPLLYWCCTTSMHVRRCSYCCTTGTTAVDKEVQWLCRSRPKRRSQTNVDTPNSKGVCVPSIQESKLTPG